MNYKIIDNFLSNEEMQNIYNVMFRNAFPWYFVNDAVPSNEDTSVKENPIFCHYFLKSGCPYDNGEFEFPPPSHFSYILKPLIKKMQIKSLLRIQANYYPRTTNIIEHGYHSDFPFEVNNCKTAIFYLNSCNGYTKLKENQKVASVGNRLLIFDSDTLHTSSTCTDKSFRAVINVNYLI